MTTGLSPRHVPPRNGFLPVLMLLLVGLFVGCGAATSHPSGPTPTPTKQLKGTITEFPIPTANSFTLGITTGPDGNLWFTETFINKIGRITPSGTVTEFPLPASPSAPVAITAGPDGNLWFTEGFGNKIGRITPGGTITEFPIPTFVSVPMAITAGPDGNLWFTALSWNKIGRITPSGTITEFPLPASHSAFDAKLGAGITTGPDGNLWFTEDAAGPNGSNKIGRLM